MKNFRYDSIGWMLAGTILFSSAMLTARSVSTNMMPAKIDQLYAANHTVTYAAPSVRTPVISASRALLSLNDLRHAAFTSPQIASHELSVNTTIGGNSKNGGGAATFVVPNPPGGCAPSPSSFTNSTPLAIPSGPAVVSATLVVSGIGTYLWDLDLTTFITHTFAGDLDITLTSPAGTVVTLTTDNGSGNDNVFNGTVWDDDSNPAGQVPYTSNPGLVTDHTFTNLVLASPLVPEEPLAAFSGENPNGTWTITISDDAGGDSGTLSSWTLNLATLSSAPSPTITPFTNSTPVAIPTGPAVVTSTLVVSGAGTELMDVNLTTFITHTFASDLDITIQSPAGTVVTLTTDNGSGNDNVFNGTVWDDDANPLGQVPYTSNVGMVTDHVYTNLVTATPLTPEEALGAFMGENPNGTWTITISDDAAGDGGSLNSWTLQLTTGSCALTPTTTTFTNNTPVNILDNTTVSSTINVTGTGSYILDLDMTTFITHTFAGDLDITITSPAGTVVTLTTDNGGGSDNVFNGTVWNDQANPSGQVPYTSNNGIVTDHTYTNLVVATPLVPEEALGAFIGENPTGIWTIRISDDAGADVGILNSWSLIITTFPSSPSTTAATATNSTPLTIPTGPAVVSSTLSVSGAGSYLLDLDLTTFITHTFNADLDITLQSPMGTVVTITTDNGSSSDNVFNGTLWDDKANPSGQVPYTSNNGLVTDHTFANLVTATPMVVEEALAAFNGENPNGTWTLTISDDVGGDGGSLNSWTLNVVTLNSTGCALGCPANIVVSNTTNQCGRVVNYPTPIIAGPCGTVTCSPPSGAFYPVGTTTISCISTAGPTCSFTIKVNDTQPPTLVCPANITLESDATCNGANVVYTPTTSDNCPGLIISSVPASGSYFPVGTTTVNILATDAGGNTASCSFTVTVVSRPKIQPSLNPVPAYVGCKQTSGFQKSIIIDNAGGLFGGGTMIWTASTLASEIGILTPSGTQGQALVFTINPVGLSSGTHTRTITLMAYNSVTGVRACNEPFVLTVNIRIEPMLNVTQTKAVSNVAYTQFTNSVNQVIAEVQSLTTPITSFTVNMVPCRYPNGLAYLRYVRRIYSFLSNGSTNVNMKLYWTDTEANSVMNTSAIQIYQQQTYGGAWTNRGGAADILTNTVSTSVSNLSGVFALATTWNAKPMYLAQLSASYDGERRRSLLDWKTDLITDADGFFIERALDDPNFGWESIGSVSYDARGSYAFEDPVPGDGVYYYRLVAFDKNGGAFESEPIRIDASSRLVEFALDQNYPNPFSIGSAASTMIAYQIPEQMRVVLKVYDVHNREVATLVNEERVGGRHEVRFDASNYTSGVYFYKIEAGSFSQIRRMTLVK